MPSQVKIIKKWMSQGWGSGKHHFWSFPKERERERNSSGPPKPSVIHLPVLKDLDSMRAKK